MDPHPAPDPASTQVDSAAKGSLLRTLLTRPGELIGPAVPGTRSRPLAISGPLLALAVASLAGYGAVAGFFQGGSQIAVAALKAPLIVFCGLLLCLPSLVVFATLAGVKQPWREFGRVAAGLAATLGVILVSLGPIAWLFSVTSRSLAFMVLFHLATWGVALLFALRGLARMLAVPAARRLAVGWTVLL